MQTVVGVGLCLAIGITADVIFTFYVLSADDGEHSEHFEILLEPTVQ